MGEWNYNQYPGYYYNRNGDYRNQSQPEYYYNQPRNENTASTPQQYTDFQDFLNQYQRYRPTPNGGYRAHLPQNASHEYMFPRNVGMNNGFQNYPPYAHEYNATRDVESIQNKFQYCNMNDSSRNPCNSEATTMRSNQTYNMQRNPRSNDNTDSHNFGQNYYVHKNSASVRNDETRAGERSSTYNVTPKSNLTATAEEFVPSKSRTDTTNESSASDESNNFQITTNTKQKSEIKHTSQKYPSSKKNSQRNDFNKSTNWRERDDDEDAHFDHISSLVFESNRNENSAHYEVDHSLMEGRRDAGSKFSKKDFQQNNTWRCNEPHSVYNERNKGFKNNRTQISVNHNNDVDNRYNNSKQRSYYSNETFRQKGYQWRHDTYCDRENENYEKGAVRKNKGISNNIMKKSDSPLNIKDINSSDITQRERLTELLNKGLLECLVCYEAIKQQHKVWSCHNCYHVLHLDCIIKWAKSSMSEGVWRCPACQNNNSIMPSNYKCFCGKQDNPDWTRGGDSAHTCGNTCGRLPTGCLRHPCTLLCHPGPCPLCNAVVTKKCECGSTSQSVKCSHNQPLLCGQICKKKLNCRVHLCEDKCHAGACKDCTIVVEQQCFCEKATTRTLLCDIDTVGISTFSCNEVCGKMLGCGNHSCTEICHPGDCGECRLLPKNVTKCPCGQTLLQRDQIRNSCLDPIPVCNEICSKLFNCGPPDNKHFCKNPCHSGECSPCPDKTVVSCKCGHMNTEILCINLENEKDNVKCKKKCTKKRSCGKHRCNVMCCVDPIHQCPIPCSRYLFCGLHRCENTCHSGYCEPCWRTSFDELRCRCGAAVRYPPVPCGARPPVCSQPCSIPRPCGHPPHHVCHPEPSTCPPCTILTQRHCYGRHKMRKAIPCHQEEFSCGLPCGKELSCKKHKCIEVCHKGDCPTTCTQQCEKERLGCGHSCGALCGHNEPCPVMIPCKRPVIVTCTCGRRSTTKTCAEHMRELQRLQAGAGLLEGAMGKPVDIKDLIAKGNTTVTLDCDDECYVEERNRRMAIGLQIRNPDISSKLTPRYSDFMKQFAARDESFCVKIHEKITELVLLAQKSKQKTRSHSFQPMSHLKRQFVHEYCEHFGCESKAYDSEPHRNIVATAYREKSWLPALSLLEVVRRDKGQRRVPGPIVGNTSTTATVGTTQKMSTNSTTGAWPTVNTNYALAAAESSRSTSLSSDAMNLVPEPPRKPKIDYFDAPPED